MDRQEIIERAKVYANRVFPREQQYVGLSGSKLLLLRMRFALELAGNTILYRSKTRPRLAKTSELEGTERGRTALVIALGPSAGVLDVEKVGELQSQDLAVFAINSYWHSPLSSVIPDYYTLADPAYFDPSCPSWRAAEGAWLYLQAHPEITLFIPAHLEPPVPLTNPVRYFNMFGAEGWSRNVLPTRPRAYIGMTAYSALAIACFLGFDQIKIIGFDTSFHKFVELNKDRQLVIRRNFHAHAEHDEENEFKLFDQTAGLMEETARMFHDFHLFDRYPIENLDPATLVDAFPIAKDIDRYRSSESH